MGVRTFVKGEIAYGQYHRFLSAVEEYKRYREKKGWVVPEVLHSLAGPMNTVMMVYSFPSTEALEAEARLTSADPQYAAVASAMGFREPTIRYELYRES